MLKKTVTNANLKLFTINLDNDDCDGPNLVLYVFSYPALIFVLFVFYGMLVALPFVRCIK